MEWNEIQMSLFVLQQICNLLSVLQSNIEHTIDNWSKGHNKYNLHMISDNPNFVAGTKGGLPKKTVFFGNFSQMADPPPPPLLGTP